MTSREYFEGVRAAQAAIDRRLTSLEYMRKREEVRAQRYTIGSHTSGNRDVMAATDARIDVEQAALDELAHLVDEVARGREVCRGVRAANPTQRWGDALEARYCEGLSWRAVALALDVSERQAMADASCALDWVDLVGLAAAQDGMGQAVLF